MRLLHISFVFVSFAMCRGCMDVVLDIDISCSIKLEDLKAMKTIAKGIVESFEANNEEINETVPFQYGMLLFNKKVHDGFYLNTYATSDEVLAAIDDLDFNEAHQQCKTKTYEALRKLRLEYFTNEKGDRNESGRYYGNLHIFMGDGKTSPASQQKITDKQADKLRDSTIETYVIGFENRKNEIGLDELNKIKTVDPLKVHESGEAEEIASEILNDLKQSGKFNCLAPRDELCITRDQGCPDPVSPNAECCTKLECLESKCIPKRPDTCNLTTTGLDVILMMDRSKSIAEDDLKEVREFFQIFAGVFLPVSIDRNQISGARIGAVSYNNKATIEFSLNEYNNTDDIVEAIGNIDTTTDKKTRTDLALDKVIKYFIDMSDENTRVVNKILLIATDGRTQPARWSKAAIAKAKQLKENCVLIMIAALPNKNGKIENEFDEVASGPEFVFPIETFRDLAFRVVEIAGTACTEGKELDCAVTDQ